MKIKKIDHVGARVSDFNRSVRFYQQFGFELIREDLKERVVVIEHPAGIVINLIGGSGNTYNRGNNVLMDIDKKHTGYTHYAFQVQSVDETKAFLDKLDICITEGPVVFGDGKASLFIRDPDLNVIEFTEHAKSDCWHTRTDS